VSKIMLNNYAMFTMDMNLVSSPCDDFSPFPSKIFSMLYFMVHSPRPMVYMQL